MSELAIFVIGSVIFAITVYGAVISGGLALGRLAGSDPDEPPVQAVAAEPSEGVGTAP
ncbi:MAG: hypothetical protein MUE36_08265 [Acidimicrobiales bacterium]|jgi:hypothetical protein|nr:hypothetical protein [Acidimicrobiales bacterium]